LRRAIAVAAFAALPALTLAVPGGAVESHGSRCHGGSWPMYGHDPRHSFAVSHGCSSITPANVATLVPAWFFHAKDSITSSVAVSHGTVYVGSWDGTFYAINAADGSLRWSFHVKNATQTAFGRIDSSAAVVKAGRGAARRRVVMFGGGSSLWVLDATTGKKLTRINLDPRSRSLRKAQKDDPPVAEVESSPVVIPARHGRDHIFVGFDVHDARKVGRTGLVALTLAHHKTWRLRPRWKHDVETGRVYRGRAGLTHGSGHGLGCGGIWSSPAVDTSRHIVVVGTASCDYPAKAYKRHTNYSEELLALRTRSGRKVWSYRPEDSLPKAQRVPSALRDADFGASANLFKLPGGRHVAGDGSKNAVYYVRKLGSGRKVSAAHAGQEGYVQGSFAVGGFIGSSAVDENAHGVARRVVGGTAIPVPDGVTDIDKATWDVRAIDPRTGKIDWVYRLGAPTYGATSVTNGIAFTTLTVQSDVVALNARTGLPLWTQPVAGPPSSTAVVAGDSVYVGTGTRETDLEYKAVSNELENALKDSIGESPLSPVSGVQAFRLATDVAH
jgi:outer membrane protein assembly factor BamB